MSTPATTLYIRTILDSQIMILTGVTSWKRGVRWIRAGTYRNTGWAAGAATQQASTSSSAGYNNAASVPLVGVPGQPMIDDKGLGNLVYATPDEMVGIAPRFSKERQSGYLFAFNGDAIDDPVADTPATPRALSVAVTVNATTDQCNATAHGFVNGDVIALSYSTIPTGYVANSLVRVAVVDANNFLLLNSAGTIVNFTATGSGVVAVLVNSALPPPEPPLPTNQTGVIFVPDAWKPRISTVDPRL